MLPASERLSAVPSSSRLPVYRGRSGRPAGAGASCEGGPNVAGAGSGVAEEGGAIVAGVGGGSGAGCARARPVKQARTRRIEAKARTDLVTTGRAPRSAPAARSRFCALAVPHLGHLQARRTLPPENQRRASRRASESVRNSTAVPLVARRPMGR